LDLSRVQAATGRPEVEANEAEDLVGAALKRASGAIGDRVVHVSLDPAHPVLIGRFNFSDALRALVNLVDNAAKHTPPASPIELDVRRGESMITFAVSDRGPGIPAAEVERIFAPFYRPPGVAPDTGGAGLGLSIARRLAEAQGGRVTHDPRPGGGSVFTLHVPLLD
jgi:two-component system sensor histidine kinase KdpD